MYVALCLAALPKAKAVVPAGMLTRWEVLKIVKYGRRENAHGSK